MTLVTARERDKVTLVTAREEGQSDISYCKRRGTK